MNNTNTATVTGMLLSPLKEDHVIHGETIYTGFLRSNRLSGAIDTLPITIPGRLLCSISAGTLAAPITVAGQVRCYNKIEGEESHLSVTLFAKNIYPSDGFDTQNDVRLEGAICRPTVYRVTPFGREICDLMLAVNRGYGKSDYVPCIVWGRNGKWVSGMKVGERLDVCGRLQSRDYEKLLDSGEVVTRTAYELSVFSIERTQIEGRAGA